MQDAVALLEGALNDPEVLGKNFLLRRLGLRQGRSEDIELIRGSSHTAIADVHTKGDSVRSSIGRLLHLLHLRHSLHHWHLHSEWVHVHQLRSWMHELVLLPHRGCACHEMRLSIFEKLLALSWVHRCHHLRIDHSWVGLFVSSVKFIICIWVHLLSILHLEKVLVLQI